MTNNRTYARGFKSARTLMFGLTLSIGGAQAAETVTYYHTDGLGTPVMESSATGAVTYAREHRPYGEQTLGISKNGPGFTGHVADADTNLTYMQARYYDPVIGRFLSDDPVSVNTDVGINFNRYWYANNNPYTFIDPDGRATCADKDCKTAYVDSRPAEAKNVNPLPKTTTQNSSPVAQTNLLTSKAGPTITFNNDKPNGASPNQPVSLETALMTEQTIINSGVQSANINSTTGGGHEQTSRHYAGKAVDINRVNGRRVDAAAAATDVRSVQNAAAATQNIRENFGPSFNQKTNTPGGTPRAVTSQGVVTAHKNHIHISGQR